MASNTPDNSHPAGDILLAETPEHVVGKAANAADEMLLQYQLGINVIPRNADANDIARRIVKQIIDRVDMTRYAISATELTKILDANISEALDRVRSRNQSSAAALTLPEQQQRALEVVRAVIQSVDRRLLDDMTRHATLDVNNPTIPGITLRKYEMGIRDVPLAPNRKFDVVIDTRNTFWVESAPLNDPVAFANALMGMRLDQAGIRIVNNPLRHDEMIPQDMANYLANNARVEIQRRDRLPGTPGVVRNISILEAQRMLHEQHQYNRILRDGSENAGAAAFAASILMRYKDAEIVGALGGPGERTEVEKKLKEARAKRDLLKLIESPDQLQPTDVMYSWFDAETTIPSEASTARGSVATTGIPLTIGAESFTTLGPGPREVAAANAWIAEREIRAHKNRAVYQRIAPMLQRILQMAFNAGVPTGALRLENLFDVSAGPPIVINGPKQNAFTPSINPPISVMLDELRNHASLKLNEGDPAEDVKKLDQQLKDIDAGKRTTLTGDAAQHAVIAAYFEKYHNCSPEEARQAAQYLRSQLLLDKQTHDLLDAVIEEEGPKQRGVIEGTYDALRGIATEGRVWGLQSVSMVRSIADACRVRRTGSRIDWEGASYPKLLRSFYTMESFIQKKGAAKVRLSKSGFVLEERKKIVRALARKHIAMCVRDLAEAQIISDDQLDAIKSDPTKAEHIQLLLEMLEQDPPAKYRQQIDQAINHVNWWHGSTVRGVGAVAGTGWKLGKGGAKLGAQYVIAKPAQAIGAGAMKTGRFVGRNKGTLATFAVATALSGGNPLVGGLAALVYRNVAGEGQQAKAA